MTTADLIAEHLGPEWWKREHDQTALCALLDRVMEEDGVGVWKAVQTICKIADHNLPITSQGACLLRDVVKSVFGAATASVDIEQWITGN